jgi:uncharacterized DUF497 family protein
MNIVWDEQKRQSNLAKHGMDFAALTVEFFETATILPANQGRFMAINMLVNGVVTVVFARLGSEGISIVSMRPASRKERNL